MDPDVAGVRISPSVLEFFDTEANKVDQLNVTVKNISKGSKSIRFYGPKTKKFKLRVKNPDQPVAPGLCVPAVVEFETNEEGEFKDRLIVTVDGEVVEIPLAAYPTQPMLEIGQTVDFGNVVANSKTIAREIPLINHGSKSGEFKIKYAGDKPIAIMPTSGTVPAKSVQMIKVELVTKQAGKFEEIAIAKSRKDSAKSCKYFNVDKVKLEGHSGPKSIMIRGNMVQRALEVLQLETEENMDCIRFGSTYYGSDKTECAILYNNGPEQINFVAVLDEDAVAQEMGIDLTQSTAVALASQASDSKEQGETNMLTSLITAIPNQGILRPYEKIPIFFRFSPRWNSSKQGFKNKVAPPPRKDFAVFMRIQIIGSNEGFLEKGSSEANSYVEVPMTATALPVLVSASPNNKFDFGECPVGEHVDILCAIQNNCPVLPITYQFRRIAHFIAHPPNGKIPPNQTQDVIFSFAPNQAGSFKRQQMLDIIGHVADNQNPTMSHLQVIHTLPIHFMGCSDPITIKKQPKHNPGITPYISNEVGLFVDTTFLSLDDVPRNAVAGGNKCKLHILRNSTGNMNNVKVAFPNDRAQSIRPGIRNDEYNKAQENIASKSDSFDTGIRTIFTRASRHTYVDPDYAYVDDEDVKRFKHRGSYVALLRELRQNRLNKKKAKEFQETNTEADIGIKPAAGIQPKNILLEEIRPDPRTPTPPNLEFRLLSTKELARSEKEASAKPVSEGLNAVPTTNKERIDCSKFLTPQELHQVIIGPPTIDFGNVCLRSVTTKHINIINNLNQYIHVVAEIDCRELRQSSPLSQVVPPKSKAQIPIIFESNQKQTFQRSVSYTVNGFYKHHVTVTAEVLPVALELSTEELVLTPTHGLPVEAGFRGIITLYNKMNFPAEFTWAPNLGERGTAFSIRPATGVVDAFKDLDCEVVWHPSYLAPEDGSFTLMVHGGSTLQLLCKAELGPTSVQFVERRIMFGQVPVNITTTRNVLLANTGENHAYFQVLDPNPFPGLTVSPLHGVVPVGGYASLIVRLTPDAVMKFDTRVGVAVKGGKPLELRMGGTVEPPSVDIEVPNFNFGGVYCGSGETIPFKIANKTITKAKLEFDLSRYKDFTLNLQGYQTKEDQSYQLLNPGKYAVTLQPEETIEGEINFIPSEVAAYDFILPVTINHTGAPSPAPTPFPPTPAPSNKNSLQHIINPKPQPFTVITPRKHVIATGLRQPLQLSSNRIEFSMPASFYDPSLTAGQAQSKGTIFVNNIDKKLKWVIDLRVSSKALEQGVFKFLHPSGGPFPTPRGEHDESNSPGVEGTLDPGQTQEVDILFCPKTPGKYEVILPILLNDSEKPYQYLHLVGELKSPKLWFDPLAIVMSPVPLKTDISAEFTIFAAQFKETTKITAVLPEVECEDTSKVSPLRVSFPEGQEVKPCCGDEGQIEPYTMACKITFSCPKPVSFTAPIKFTLPDGKFFNLMVTATADNCLLTCYPFLAIHRTDHQIVCEQGSSPKGHKTTSKESLIAGEAVFVPCQTPQLASRPSTSATSSNFQISSSSYESTTSVTDSTERSTPRNRDGAMNKPPSGSDRVSRHNPDLASRSLGSAVFPDEDSEEGIFYMEVLLAVQRWFSAQGWPGGPYPVIIPNSLRCGISKKILDDDSPKAAKAGSWDTNNIKKDFKTIYDMVGHLTGRQVPGIPIGSPLPSDLIERVKQIYWQHSTLLTFIRCQGGSVAAIKPEYLMEPRDYQVWKQMQKQAKAELLKEGMDEEAEKLDGEDELEDDVFEAVSKRAWTDILLQLLKTLVLAKVTPKTLKNTPSPDKNIGLPEVNPDPLSSNIYGVGERITLAWLNHHYEHYRQKIWANCKKGGVPPARWIVNYDFDLLDGLVIGAVLGAHMPFVISSHLEDMYTHPATAEQCLHNALKIVSAMRYAGIDYDIQAIDITDPNPIALLLLCISLYQRLPQYVPKATVEFTGSLHQTIPRQVKLSNPSSKPLVYQVFLAGRDARDFHIPKGEHVTIPPKSMLPLVVEFKSRFLRPAEAILVLVGRRQGSAVGTTLTFNLQTQVDNITPMGILISENIIKCESPCFELEKIPLEITNPFSEGGEFRIVLVEASGSLLNPSKHSMLMTKKKEKKKKKIKSKIDTGIPRPETPPTPPPNIADSIELPKEEEETELSAFYSPVSTVNLNLNESATVEIHFLPFNIGERQCSVIFLNEALGEFLYCIQAKATLPLPTAVPFVKTAHSVRISSAAAADESFYPPKKGTGKGLFGGDDRVVYWKCEAGQLLEENLIISASNEARERALLLAAQQQMSEKEFTRRMATDTLQSSSILSKTITKLAKNPESAISQAKARLSPKGTTFTVECDSSLFMVPEKIVVPPLTTSRRHSAPVKSSAADLEGSFKMPIKFRSKEPGHYPCQIVLRGKDDVRVFRIECTVNPEGSTAEIEFIAPVHQSVVQEIPLVNMTNHDWPLEARIEGTGFFGPPHLLAKAYQTSRYPLQFRPQNEKYIKGKLVLTNIEDATEHMFHLNGIPDKPLALDRVVLKCEAKKTIMSTLKIPNATRKKLCYKVESDIPFISGDDSITVLPGQQEMYTMKVSPLRRGVFKGVVAFIAGKSPVVEVDSDGDEVPNEDDELKEFYGYRVWYSVEVNVKPPPPERILEVTCACQKKSILEVIVRNPTTETITLEATIQGQHLSGNPSITLPPGSKDIYTLTYAPAIIGTIKGSLIFYHESVGEFWYSLRLTAESPPQTTLPHMECELGRWTKQNIVLDNPTEETLELIPTISNSNNFSLERDNERPIILRPFSNIEVPLHFMPSTLGQGDHLAKIIFHSEQLGEWIFVASGTGLLPLTQDPVSVYTVAGSNTTLIIPFRNPMDHAVVCQVMLTDNHKQLDELLGGYSEPESAFCLLLKHKEGIRVGPKSTLDIPVCFAPTEMKMYESTCTVIVRKENNGKWQYAPKDSRGFQLSRTGSDGLSEIRWIFPIHGIPESRPIKEQYGAVIDCKARERLEERLEVTLAGVAPSTSGPHKSIQKRSITPKNEQPKVPDGIVVGETLATAEEFTHELTYKDSDGRENLRNCVALNLIRQHRDSNTGLVVLVFNVVFSPFKAMDHDATLEVKAAQGGVWKFPIRFVANEPPVDDVITIEASGLGKESSAGFRLTSQTNTPVQFNAYFAAGSDPEFFVFPQTGELLPQGSGGTLLRVSFLPSVYGKLYQGRLVLQTPDMQWSYSVKGVLPEYTPPRGQSSRPIAGPHPDPRQRQEKQNYILENLKLKTTAVSSPIKGAPLIYRAKLG